MAKPKPATPVRAPPLPVPSSARAPPRAPPGPAPARPPDALVSGARSLSLSTGPGNPWPLFGATLRGLIAAKKTIFLMLLLLVPAFLTIVVANSKGGLERFGRELHEENPNIPDDQTGGLLWFQEISFTLLYPFLLPLVVALFSSSVIRDEVEGKTLPYLFTRPLYRNWLVVPKFLGIASSIFIMGFVALVAFWFTSVSTTENPFRHMAQLWGFAWVLLLAVLATSGLFIFAATAIKRSWIVVGLYLFVWETIMSQIPASFIRRSSVVHYERSILYEVAGRPAEFAEQALIGSTSPVTAHIVLILLAVLGLVGALYMVSNKDYNV